MNKKIILTISAVLILLANVLLIYKNYNTPKYELSSIRVTKRLDESLRDEIEINLSNEERKKIDGYIKKSNLNETKQITNCAILGIYSIYFGDYTLSFDRSCSTTYLYNANDNKSVQVNISNKFKDYIIDLSK